MKAFLVKWIGFTETKPSRLRVSYPQNGFKFYSVDSFKDIDGLTIQHQAIERFMLDNGLTVNPFIVGQLPNGDYCGVFS